MIIINKQFNYWEFTIKFSQTFILIRINMKCAPQSKCRSSRKSVVKEINSNVLRAARVQIRTGVTHWEAGFRYRL